MTDVFAIQDEIAQAWFEGDGRAVVFVDTQNQAYRWPLPSLEAPATEMYYLAVDNTGSHTGLVMASAATLATDLVARLEADMDVQVGVATFAEGRCSVPVNGLTSPSVPASAPSVGYSAK